MKNNILLGILILLFGISFGSTVKAAPAGAVVVDQSQIFTVYSDLGQIVCASLDDISYTPGELVSGGKFLSYQQKIKNFKKSLAKRPNQKKSAQIKKNMAKTKAKLKLGKNLCQFDLSPTPNPTSDPGSNSNFDLAGNLTEVGKLKFGVPSSLSGNVSLGKQVRLSFCTCHVEQLNHAFDFYREKTSAAPMFFSTSELTDEMLANLTAYLNRFNLP